MFKDTTKIEHDKYILQGAVLDLKLIIQYDI